MRLADALTYARCPQARGLDGEEPDEEVMYVSRDTRPVKRARTDKGPGGAKAPKGRDWVLKKKAQMRKKGYDIAPDSKYTGRKRKHIV